MTEAALKAAEKAWNLLNSANAEPNVKSNAAVVTMLYAVLLETAALRQQMQNR